MKPKNSQTSNPETIELTIDSLSYNGGRGVGRYDGLVVFVGGTVPGDHIRARVTHKKSRLWEAELVEILAASPERRPPPCPVAGRCGGCTWQQVEYVEQIRQKQKILSDSLRSLHKYGDWVTLPFVPAPSEFHYRNRIQVHTRGGQSGFFAQRTRDLVPIDKCWIADERLNERLRTIKPADGAKTEIAVNARGETLAYEGERDPESALFSQVNTAQNERLKELLLSFISITPSWWMDLYAGSGNLTELLAQKFPSARMTAIEFSKKSAELGRLLLPQVQWIAADAGQGLQKIHRPQGTGLIVVDPPRTGLSTQTCDELIRLAPQQIVYVSCNPSTFARDVERLVQNSRFRLEQVQGLDMFPQTEHVELIASLRAAT